MLRSVVGRRWRVAPMFTGALASSSMLTIIDQGVFSLTNLIWVRQLGRSLSLEQLGDYYCLMSFVLLFMNSQAQLLTAPYSVRCHGKKTERELDQYTGALFVHQSIVMGLSVAVFGVAFLISRAVGWPANAAVAALSFAAPCYLARMFVRYVSFARSQHHLAVLLDLGVAIVQLTGLAFLWWTERLQLVNVFLVLGLACGFVVPFWLRWTPMRWNRPGSLSTAWKENWQFGKWALLSFAVGGVLSHVFPVIVALFANRTEAGFLGACTTISGFATMFVVGLANALTPAAARAYTDGGHRALNRVLAKNGLVMGVAVGSFLVASVFGGDWILTHLVYNSRFLGQGPTLAWLVAGVLGLAVSVVFGNGLWAIQRPKLNLYADSATLVVTLIGAVLLVRPMGALGAAVSICIGNLVGAIVRAFVYQLACRAASERA
jgi:O-antigen/teichoic acid export membrane protein